MLYKIVINLKNVQVKEFKTLRHRLAEISCENPIGVRCTPIPKRRGNGWTMEKNIFHDVLEMLTVSSILDTVYLTIKQFYVQENIWTNR